MAAIANIVINDAVSPTPVAHTFAPDRTPDGGSVWLDRSASQYIGFNKLTLSMVRPKGPSGQATRNIRLIMKLETPKLEVTSNNTVSGIAPAPTVSYRPVLEMHVTCPERCTLQDRKDLQKYAQQLLTNSFVTDLFEKYELAY